MLILVVRSKSIRLYISKEIDFQSRIISSFGYRAFGCVRPLFGLTTLLFHRIFIL